MARDHALADAATSERAVLRLYGWSSPTVSLGRNEPAAGRYDLEAARARAVSFVRRPTGGRAVLHHREVTYSVTAALRAFGGLREAFLAIHRSLERGLAELGVEVSVKAATEGERALPPSAGPCFRDPSPGELVAEGRKLVGSAQARLGSALLQHGSVLLENDQPLVALLAGGDSSTPADQPATLRSLTGTMPDRETVIEALAEGFRQEMGGTWTEGEAESMALPVALLEHYRSSEWTWRR